MSPATVGRIEQFVTRAAGEVELSLTGFGSNREPYSFGEAPLILKVNSQIPKREHVPAEKSNSREVN